MKIGDIVMSTKTRPYENAKVVQVDISNRLVNGRTQTRTKYVAEYKDGSKLNFCGANVNHSVFRVQTADGQMKLEDFMTWEEN